MLNASQKMKSTPVGNIPVDWECVKLGEIAKITSGGTPSRTNPAYWGGLVPWIKTGAINFCIILEPEEWITELATKESAAKWVPKGAILMAMYGQGKTRGQVAILGIDATTNQACAAIITKQNITKEFLYFFLASRYLHIRSLSNTGNQENLSGSLIRGINIALPPLPEQRKIAEILGTWDRAIDTQQQLINSLTRRKKALMQQLLTGKTRLPGFEGGWEEVKLSDLFSRVSTKNKEGHTQVVTISAQRGLICQQDYFNKQIASKILDNYFVLKKGQFAYNKSYSKGYPMGAIKRLNRYDHGVVTTLYICFKIKSEDDSYSNFWEHYFESGVLNRGLTRIAHEGGRAHGLLNVTPKDFFELKIKAPSIKEQKAIARVLTTADREITLHTKHLASLRTQKRGLMQQLLTGKTRVTL